MSQQLRATMHRSCTTIAFALLLPGVSGELLQINCDGASGTMQVPLTGNRNGIVSKVADFPDNMPLISLSMQGNCDLDLQLFKKGDTQCLAGFSCIMGGTQAAGPYSQSVQGMDIEFSGDDTTPPVSETITVSPWAKGELEVKVTAREDCQATPGTLTYSYGPWPWQTNGPCPHGNQTIQSSAPTITQTGRPTLPSRLQILGMGMCRLENCVRCPKPESWTSTATCQSTREACHEQCTVCSGVVFAATPSSDTDGCRSQNLGRCVVYTGGAVAAGTRTDASLEYECAAPQNPTWHPTSRPVDIATRSPANRPSAGLLSSLAIIAMGVFALTTQ